ncbi:hypothetical protein TGDOM2_229770 [Toxoplasma gondii GAB2-2007-GAL-DOM2]|uniref:Uncharacterized protein n=6 Tax=Toxoplasma gondii TaxID=5811 RepID=S7WIS5_TOXGG|nr:hypothetical protein TGGT1_229770 [Toxoplasma gondii GT1]KAF4641626.1 hypothetical protein TGRH88_074360 [Toxoplasma gondii]KFG48142.1 hypothetical protein TGDOM2_229770 [Toxoplasma gondii GAB2-2007-GAL-DOM2]KFG55563.1 hypothetical protein TGFOU_229770 [Toxoplasma gondii FOU]RQX74756.1 hypothetical protein TGCAST_229770 [Toxoplasma gondii CAST]
MSFSQGYGAPREEPLAVPLAPPGNFLGASLSLAGGPTGPGGPYSHAGGFAAPYQAFAAGARSEASSHVGLQVSLGSPSGPTAPSGPSPAGAFGATAALAASLSPLGPAPPRPAGIALAPARGPAFHPFPGAVSASNFGAGFGGGQFVQHGYVPTTGLVPVTPQQSRSLAVAAVAATAALAAEAAAETSRGGGPAGPAGSAGAQAGYPGKGGVSRAPKGARLGSQVDALEGPGAPSMGPRGDRETDPPGPGGQSSRRPAPGAPGAGPGDGLGGILGALKGRVAPQGADAPHGDRDEGFRESRRPPGQNAGRRDAGRLGISPACPATPSSGQVGHDVMTAVAVENESLKWSLFISNALKWAAAPELDFDEDDGGWGSTLGAEGSVGDSDAPTVSPRPSVDEPGAHVAGASRAPLSSSGGGEGAFPFRFSSRTPPGRGAGQPNEPGCEDEEEAERQRRRTLQAQERLRRKKRFQRGPERSESPSADAPAPAREETLPGPSGRHNKGLEGLPLEFEERRGDKGPGGPGCASGVPSQDPGGAGDSGGNALGGRCGAGTAPASPAVWGMGMERKGEGDSQGARGTGAEGGYFVDSGAEEEEEEDAGLLRVLGVCCNDLVEDIVTSAVSYAMTLRGASARSCPPSVLSSASSGPDLQPASLRVSQGQTPPGGQSPGVCGAPEGARQGLSSAAAAAALEGGGTGRVVEVTKEHVDFALDRLWGEETVQGLLEGIRERKRANRSLRLRREESRLAQLAKGGDASPRDSGPASAPRQPDQGQGEEGGADEDLLAEELFFGGCFAEEGNEVETQNTEKEAGPDSRRTSAGQSATGVTPTKGQARRVLPAVDFYREALEKTAAWNDIDRSVSDMTSPPAFHEHLAQAEFLVAQTYLREELEKVESCASALDGDPDAGPLALGHNEAPTLSLVPEGRMRTQDGVASLLAEAQTLAKRAREKAAKIALEEQKENGARPTGDQDSLLCRAFDFGSGPLSEGFASVGVDAGVEKARVSSSSRAPADFEGGSGSSKEEAFVFELQGRAEGEHDREGQPATNMLSEESTLTPGVVAEVEPRLGGQIEAAERGGREVLRPEETPYNREDAEFGVEFVPGCAGETGEKDEAENERYDGDVDGDLEQALEEELEECLLLGVDEGAQTPDAVSVPRPERQGDDLLFPPEFPTNQARCQTDFEGGTAESGRLWGDKEDPSDLAPESSGDGEAGDEEGNLDLEEELFGGMEEEA